MSNPKLSIIIVSYNVQGELNQALEALMPQAEQAEAEVIIVDNGSTDGTPDFLRTGPYPVRCIANHENLGFARANNIGIAAAAGRCLLFLNPDTIVQPEFLHWLQEGLNSKNDVAAVGPRAFWDRRKQFLISSLKIPTPLVSWITHSSVAGFKSCRYFLRRHWETDWRYWTAGPEPFPVPAIGGAYMMVRREALDKVGGGFDSNYFLGYEDVDLCLRFRAHGYRLLAAPQAQIVHLYGASKRKSPESVSHCLRWERDPRRFLEKHYGRFRTMMTGAMLSLEQALRAARTERQKRTIKDLIPDPEPRGSGVPARLSNEVTGWDATPLELTWPQVPHASGYLVELATSPCFLDKFGHFTTDTELKLSLELMQQATPGKYFYRVLTLPLQSVSVIQSGHFAVL